MIIKIIKRNKPQTASAIVRMVKYVRAERETDADDGKCIPGYGGSNFGCTEEEGQAQLEDFLDLAQSNPSCEKPMMHVVISWAAGEHPTPEHVRQAVGIWAHDVGAAGLDLIWATHGNTNNFHTHILVCLIDPITSKVRDLGLWKRKSQRAKARIIGLQGLEACKDDLYLPAPDGGAVMNPNASHWGGPESDILDAPPPLQDKQEEALKKARAIVLPALEQSKTWAEFHDALVVAGIGIRKSGPGLVFLVNDEEIKGSKISKRKASLKQLEKKLGGPYVEGPATVQPQPEGADGVVRNLAAQYWQAQEPDGPEIPPALTPEAQAIERRHGIKSKQRIAQERVPAALERAEAAGGEWKSYHEALAESGIVVRPSGAGLVYVVGGVEIRASHVSRRKCLRPALEERFGTFEEASVAVLEQAEAVATSMGPEPVEDMPADLLPWLEDYTRNREDWLNEERRLTEENRAKRERLRKRLQTELNAQLAEAGEELRRARALGGRRSLPRGAGAALRLALRDRGAARGRALRKALAEAARCRRRLFPDSFAAWLEAEGQAELAETWRRRVQLARERAEEREQQREIDGMIWTATHTHWAAPG